VQPTQNARRVAAVIEGEHVLPARRFHPRGYQVSILASLLMAVIIGAFFIGMAGWSPRESWQELADFSVTWILLTYIWVQMGSLILVGAGTKNQMWLDALTSIIPLFLIFYVVIQHYSGYVILSPFQTRAAWVTAYTMLLDVVIDLGVSVLLSRQVVDVGTGGVA
jgi:amino acid transporter